MTTHFFFSTFQTIDGSIYRGILYTMNTEEMSFILDKPVLEVCFQSQT